ncbi:hypothetical protein Nepgr_017106 [Nepenthes gracilis]|uniref:Uncharacterized protein n=1 Tax=Nepenthes gracilis TaxID=150966 RepID=A0AAD3SQZ5_NEPGR|nr:hypothetical protein Nepgr_017106 [Nepenthes gracilis]
MFRRKSTKRMGNDRDAAEEDVVSTADYFSRLLSLSQAISPRVSLKVAVRKSTLIDYVVGVELMWAMIWWCRFITKNMLARELQVSASPFNSKIGKYVGSTQGKQRRRPWKRRKG